MNPVVERGGAEAPCCCFTHLKLHEIGSGDSASVYQLFNSSNFPLRLVIKAFGKRPDQCPKEYEMLKELGHDNIVNCLGKPRKVGNVWFLLLEMMTKRSLMAYVQATKITPMQAQKFMRQILKAVEHIHAKHMIHRDIRCTNILVGEGDTCKLADFDRAIKLDGDQELPGGIGDLPAFFWTAPEVCVKGSTYGYAADIYSLGCTLIELLSGKPPFQELNIPWKDQVQASGLIPAIPNRFPEDAQNFIQRCIQKDPRMRPTASELLEDDYVRNAEEISSSDHTEVFPSVVLDMFVYQKDPVFLKVKVESPSQQDHLDTCCMAEACAWLDPTGIAVKDGLVALEDIFPICEDSSRSRRIRNQQTGIHCTAGCRFLRLSEEDDKF